MRTTPIILDRLDAALGKQGIKLKRSQLLETAAMAFGYHNQNEFTAAAKGGNLDASPVTPIGRLIVEGTALIAVKDPNGSIYAIEESFIEQAVEKERRESFGPSPYGGLVDLTDVASHPVTGWSLEANQSSDDDEPRFISFDEENDIVGKADDFETAKEMCREDGKTHIRASIVDRAEWVIMHYKMGWRKLPLADMTDQSVESVILAKRIADVEMENENLQNNVESLINLAPDWRKWEKDLKKASQKGKEPINDEDLYRFRHAVADNHCKSSSSERYEVTYREQKFVSSHLGGLLTRLDQAEDALRTAGLAPANIARKTVDDATERLAAIDALLNESKPKKIEDLFEVTATRDGEMCTETFHAEDIEAAENKARQIAAKAFRMNLEDFRDSEGDCFDFDSECDSFDVQKVTMPDAIGIMREAMLILSTSMDSAARDAKLKLAAACEALRPKATI